MALWLELGVPITLEDLKGNTGGSGLEGEKPVVFVIVAGGSTVTFS